MTLPKRAIVLSVLAMILVCASGGRAQQDSIGDLGLTVRQDDLDSFWLNTQNWLSYGYRPYARTHVSRFDPGMPSYWSGRSGYSFGTSEPAGNAPWEGGPPVKFQLTKYGTWH